MLWINTTHSLFVSARAFGWQHSRCEHTNEEKKKKNGRLFAQRMYGCGVGNLFNSFGDCVVASNAHPKKLSLHEANADDFRLKFSSAT